MPNQRAKNKVYLGGFVEKELHSTLTRFARRAGMQDNRFGVATLLMREALERRERSRRRWHGRIRPASASPRSKSAARRKVSPGRH